MGCYLSTVDSNTDEIGCSPRSRARKKERKKQLLEALAAEAKSNELLSRIPGRMCANGSCSMASIFTQQGRKGTNQDAMIVWENFASRTDTTFCGVFDGHGPYGHLVARRVRDSLPTKLVAHWKARMRGEDINPGSILEEDDWNESGNDDLDLKNPEMFKVWKDSFLRAYNVMDKELRAHPTIDCFCSGTTAVTLLLQGRDLIIGNVGDSRAILGTKTKGNTMEAVQLTVDLKPNLPKEAERIKQCKGRVFALEDEPEVARVWLPHDDSPGLAMARAFGDFCLKDFGLIAVPDITYHQITDRDQFIVLATDGVWDVLSNKDVVDVVSSAPTRTTAARALVETAVRAWRLKYPTSKVDDCAVVCLFLNLPPRSSVEYKPERLHKASRTADEVAAAGNNNNNSNTTTDHIMPGEPTSAPATTENDKAHAQEEGENVYIAAAGMAHSPELDRSNNVWSGEDVEEDETNKTATHDKYNKFLDRVKSSGEITKEEKMVVERSHSRRSLAECLSTADDEEWSALEGVTRVNSLLNLPRFLVGDKRGRGGSGSGSGGGGGAGAAGAGLKKH